MKKFFFAVVFLGGLLAFGSQAKAADITDLSITATSTTPSATANYTISFTTPMKITTSGYVYISGPYLYSGNSYSSVNMSSATLSSGFTESYGYDSYMSVYPNAEIASGSTVSITLSGVTNPSIEGSGSWYISVYDYSQYDYSNASSVYYASASYTFRYDDTTTKDDLRITVKTSTGTPIRDVWVYVNYYSSSSYYDASSYEYYYQQTDASGNAYFNGLTANRSYNVSFYYSGTATTELAPSATTLTYTGTGGDTSVDQGATYAFVVPTVLTRYKTTAGTAISSAYWYIYSSNWSWIGSGSTATDGAVNAPSLSDGSYTLYVYDSTTYNYEQWSFSVTGGTDNLADTINPPTPNISGQVTAGGTGVASISVSLWNDSYTVYKYGTTDSNGNYSLAVSSAGTYNLSISSWGLPAGYSVPDTMQVTVSNVSTPITQNIVAVTNSKTISGRVSKKNGDAVTDAYLYAYNNSGGYASTSTDASGNYSMSLKGGSWSVWIYSNTYPATWSYTGDNVTIKFESNDTTETKTYNWEVSGKDSAVTGRFLYADGTPAGSNQVSLSLWSSNGDYAYGSTGADGTFNLPVTGGTYSASAYVSVSSYGAPDIGSISVPDDETVDLGDLTLLSRNAQITGSSTDSNGAGVSGVYMYAWKSSGSYDWASTTTGDDGTYTLYVTPGTWSVSLWVSSGSDANSGVSYSYLGTALTVVVADGETVSGNNFLLQSNDSSLRFSTVNTSGNALDDQYGWASLTSSSTTSDYGSWYGSLGCYVSLGACEVDLPAGSYNTSYYSYSNWGSSGSASYTYSHPEQGGTQVESVTITAGSTANVNLVLAENDVVLSGEFLDSAGDPIDDLYWAEVYAYNGQSYAYAWVNQDSNYTLSLSAGTWTVSYWVDYTSGYLSSPESESMTLVSGDNITKNFTLLQSNSSVTVNAVDPDGQALANAFIDLSTQYGTQTTDTGDQYGLINQTTYTDLDGNAELTMPEGEYYVTASLPSSEGYISPEPQLVTADPDNATSLTMVFLESDASIAGQVTDGAGITRSLRKLQAVGDPVAAYVYGWSESGHFSETNADESGMYTLNVIAGATWHIGAVFEAASGNYYYSDEVSIDVADASYSQDLTLSNTGSLPEPQTVIFTSSEPTVMTLSDGTTLDMPANSISAENEQVTVTATPVAEIAHTASDQPVSYAYDFVATDSDNNMITEFASNVTITLPYNEETLAEDGIAEEELSVNYYSDSSGDWAPVTSVVVDTENDAFVITTDHFTKYALMSGVFVQAANGGSGEDGEDGEDGIQIEIFSAPENFEVTERSAKKLSFSWDEVNGADSYRIQLLSPKTGKSIKTVSAANTTKTVKKLKANKKYSVRIRAVDGDQKSAWSEVITVRTKPSAPKNMKVVPGTTSAVISWKKARGTVKKYIVRVYQSNGTLGAKLKTKKRKITVSDLKSGGAYSVRVSTKFNAKNISSLSKKVEFTTLTE